MYVTLIGIINYVVGIPPQTQESEQGLLKPDPSGTDSRSTRAKC